MKVLILVLSVMLGLVILEITRPVNYVDGLNIKCGRKLPETCPSTGINWSK